MTNIHLHKERGLDPHMETCRFCGKETNGIIIGAIKIVEDPDGKIISAWSVGQKKPKDLPSNAIIRDAMEGENIPLGVCDECEKEINKENERIDEVMSRGGIMFRCVECGVTGTIEPSPAADAVREQTGVKPPKRVGLEFECCSNHIERGLHFNQEESESS